MDTNDKLSKICKDAKDVPRKKISTLDGNVVTNVKTIIVEVNVLHVNVATRSRIIEE
jgi:hypothetical protein